MALVMASSSGVCCSSFSSLPSLRFPVWQAPLTRASSRCHRLIRLSIHAAKLPPGVESPKEEPKLPVAFWGFTENAEIWNSRAAMIGIIGLYIFELVINKGILQLIGFEVGKGLNLPL